MMSNLQTLSIAAVFLLLAIGSQPGCHHSETTAEDRDAHAGPGHHDDHDPDDVPISEADVAMPANFRDAVERIAAYCHAIEQAVTAGHPSKAHRPLDEADIVLSKFMPIVRDSGVPRRQWETINVTAREIREQLAVVHEAIDAGKESITYPAEAIGAALEQLKSLTEHPNSSPNSTITPAKTR
jgi:hypothetical protein